MNRKIKKCLITGSTGSGGSYLAEHILSKGGIKVFGIYRSKGFLNYLKKKHKNKITFYKCDMVHYNKLKTIIQKIKPDTIFHIASNADVKGSFYDTLAHAKNNNSITLNLLEAVRNLNFKPLIMICSSSEVYGNVKSKDIPVNEGQQIAPINPYAVTKTFQDLMSQVYYKSFGLNIIITRMFSYTNARRLNLFQSAFAYQLLRIKYGKQKHLKHGNLNSLRTFVDIDDGMEAYWLAAKRGAVGEVYNIGGDDIISVKNYLKELIKISGLKVKCVLDKTRLRPTDIKVQIPSTKKFRKHTGWRPKISFKKSIKKFFLECEQYYLTRLMRL